MALCVAKIDYVSHEIELKRKPPGLLAVSPKATVPVLVLPDGTVWQESLDIMRWALSLYDPHDWLGQAASSEARFLLERNDGLFKHHLDRYKYATRHPEAGPFEARDQAVLALINPLDERLCTQPFIGGPQPTLQDIAIFPFVRQFAGVDPLWFEQQMPARVRQWLSYWVGSDLFKAIMKKDHNDTGQKQGTAIKS
jgi:glutathione S-transferase